MQEYTISDNLPKLYNGSLETLAILNISLECDDTYLEFVADPNDGTVSIASVGTPDDSFAFDVEDFELIATLLLRQAQR